MSHLEDTFGKLFIPSWLPWQLCDVVQLVQLDLNKWSLGPRTIWALMLLWNH